jgi:hypothetical protein
MHHVQHCQPPAKNTFHYNKTTPATDLVIAVLFLSTNPTTGSTMHRQVPRWIDLMANLI